MAASAWCVLEWWWDGIEAEFTLQENGVGIIVEVGVLLMSWQAVQGESCEWCEEGWECWGKVGRCSCD